MTALLSLLFWSGIAFGLLALWGFVLGRFFLVQPQPDAIFFVTTEDGWRLALSRFEPQKPLHGSPAVLLCPGAGLSSAIFDISLETSLARYLATHGYDIWLVDLRGRGLSDRPQLGGRHRSRWSFDDYVDFDLPAVLDEVARRTGGSQVHWIGFGTGALLLWAAGPGPASRQVKTMVALAAPLFFQRQRESLPRWLLWLIARLPIPAVLRLLSPALGRVFVFPFGLLQNRDNVDGATLRRALVSAGCSLSRPEVRQYAEWLEGNTFQGVDQLRDFRKALQAFNIPTMVVQGPRDELAPPDVMEATVEALSGVEEKVVLLASRMHGMSCNYGHLDLLLGRNVQRDLFPHLLRWLDLHADIPATLERPHPPRSSELDRLEEDAPGPWIRVGPLSPDRSLSTVPDAQEVSQLTATPPPPPRAELVDEPEVSPAIDEDDDETEQLWGTDGDVPRVPS